MIFDCHGLPFMGGKCEWQVLHSFVAAFNKNTGARYSIEKCLDVAEHGSKQPEVLLKCEEKPDMVIERKSVVYPENYIEIHKRFHYLGDQLSRLFGDRFKNNPHVLKIHEKSLDRKTNFKKEMDLICSEINKGVLSGVNPFPWRLSRFASKGENGIGIEMDCIMDDWGNLIEINTCRENTIKGYRKRCGQALMSAVEKFAAYPNALRIVLLQFIGSSDYIDDNDVPQIVSETIPKDRCDQVWVAFEEWVNERESKISWKCIWARQEMR